MKKAVLIAELIPGSGRSGQEKYNADVIAAFAKQDYEIHLVITSPRRDLIAGAFRAQKDIFASVNFIHFRPRGHCLLPISIMAAARSIKRSLPQNFWPRDMRGKRVHIGRWLSGKERFKIEALTSQIRPDLILTDTIFRSIAKNSAEKSATDILILHDIFDERCSSIEENGYEPVPRIEQPQEVDIWKRHSGLVTINGVDGMRVTTLAEAIPHRTIYPNINTSAAKNVGDAVNGSSILFIGAGGPHNIDGLRWFLTECWPSIRRAVPMAVCEIVGTIGHSIMPDDGLIIHGQVEDLIELAKGCKMAINPLRMGSGLKIKMIDYLELGLPCVATQIGADGFPTEPERPFVIVNSADEFAAETISILTDGEKAENLGSKIPAYVEQFTEIGASASAKALMNQIQES